MIVVKDGVATEYPSGTAAAKALGVKQSDISHHLTGRGKIKGIELRFRDCKDVQ